jgi:hypothetical protein
MTKFNKEDFSYHGGYLMYHGDCGKFNEYYAEPCHSTRLGMLKEKFVARFKYSSADKGRFLTFLIKNFTVEEYFSARNAKYGPLNNPHSPATILAAKGYISATVRKGMKRNGYTIFNTASYREHFEKHVSSSDAGCSEYWASVDAEHAAILAA